MLFVTNIHYFVFFSNTFIRVYETGIISKKKEEEKLRKEQLQEEQKQQTIRNLKIRANEKAEEIKKKHLKITIPISLSSEVILFLLMLLGNIDNKEVLRNCIVGAFEVIAIIIGLIICIGTDKSKWLGVLGGFFGGGLVGLGIYALIATSIGRVILVIIWQIAIVVAIIIAAKKPKVDPIFRQLLAAHKKQNN